MYAIRHVSGLNVQSEAKRVKSVTAKD